MRGPRSDKKLWHSAPFNGGGALKHGDQDDSETLPDGIAPGALILWGRAQRRQFSLRIRIALAEKKCFLTLLPVVART
jgi:hypothetical protein